MDSRLELLARLAQEADSKIILLILDGVGDLRTADQPRTALEQAQLPNFDDLAHRASLGRLVPTTTGVTPGSGPGHLALFGYDPTAPETDIGRGVLEALGLGLAVEPADVTARGNFATADAEGLLTDRRAGRIPTSECERLCAAINDSLRGRDFGGASAEVYPGEAYRFVLVLRGDGLAPDLADTDPQKLGTAPLPARASERARDPVAAAETAARVREILAVIAAAIAAEPRANRALLRGFSRLPDLPRLPELYRLRCGAFAGYPLYRGVAGACGMEVVPSEGKYFRDLVPKVRERWDDFDFFFLHVKQPDQAGEDGDLAKKVQVLEDVDRDLPDLLALEPDVLAVTGDHSTPSLMRSHSWHPIPLLLHAPATCFVDDCRAFDELEAIRGAVGTLPSRDLLGLLLAHGGRLKKFGA